MNDSSSPRFRLASRGWLGGILLLLLALATAITWTVVRKTSPPEPLRILLARPMLEKGCGLSPVEAEALNELLEDILDVHGHRAVTRLPEAPPAAEWAGNPKSGLILRLHPRRVGQRLRLDAEYLTVRDHARGGTWIRRDGRPLLPADAFDDLLKQLPGPVIRADRVLLPRQPSGLWEYLALRDRVRREGPQEAQLAFALEAAGREPGSAAWQNFLGRLHLGLALRAQSPSSNHVNDALQRYTRALALCPGYPAAVAELTRVKVDSGAPREALALLQEARRLRPDSLHLGLALAYVARTTGLDEVALRACGALDHRYLHPRNPYPFHLAYLYAGDRERFLQSLSPVPDQPWDAILTFFRGYAALVGGDRATALAAFQEGARTAKGNPKAQALCRAFLAILEGRDAEARTLLDALEAAQSRSPLPDGESTFNLAEARALLGDHERAMDLAHLAFAQGFGNLTWFRTSPFLAPLRSQPRWAALEAHLAERQEMLRRAFPADAWAY